MAGLVARHSQLFIASAPLTRYRGDQKSTEPRSFSSPSTSVWGSAENLAQLLDAAHAHSLASRRSVWKMKKIRSSSATYVGGKQIYNAR